MRRHLSSEPGVSPELKRLIEIALAFEPQHRYSSAADFSRAIDTTRVGRATTETSGSEETRILTSTPCDDQHTIDSRSLSISGELLAKLEEDLAAVIGPFSRFAIKKAFRKVADLDSLYQEVARYIENTDERGRFIATARSRTPDVGRISVSCRSNAFDFRRSKSYYLAPDQLDRIQTSLTRYIGPIAGVVLRRQMSRSASLADFYRDLASFIPDERDRAAFLKTHARGH